MTFLRDAVRYGYIPFMMFGLTGAAYWVVCRAGRCTRQYVGLPLARAVARHRICNSLSPPSGSHPSLRSGTITPPTAIRRLTRCTFWPTRYPHINGVLLIPVICWLFPFQGLWPTQWPIWSQVLIAFLFADFAFMVMHYLSHRFAPLWRLHSVHHGVGRIYGYNGVIRHPLHQVIDMIVGNMPLVIMGMPVPVAVVLGFLISITLIVQHSNVDTRLGPLAGYLAIGRVHHLHHVNWGTEGDCNFGLLLAVWDRLFGTFRDAAAADHIERYGRRRATELPEGLHRTDGASVRLQARCRRARTLPEATRRQDASTASARPDHAPR